MESPVCHKGTLRVSKWFAAAILLAGTAGFAQTAPAWRKVGSASVDLRLAGPATGPVAQVWFAPGGGVLYARAASGAVFETADYETWTLVAGAAEPPAARSATAARLPEASARILASSSNPNLIFGLGRHLYRSEDAGHAWHNLTAFGSRSVIGDGVNSVAVSPVDADQLVAANGFGVWRSLDGGLSWSALNLGLPNLPVRRILSTVTGTSGTIVEVESLGTLELPPSGSLWHPVDANAPEALLKEFYSSRLQTEITAVGQSGSTVYAGSADGRIWVSMDGGRTFPAPAWTAGGGHVERIFADPTEPRVALAALSGAGPHVLRTTNSGGFWDTLDFNLPNRPAHAVTADRTAGAIYVATDAGVFYGVADLENPSANPVNWVNLSTRLPAAPAYDVRLDPASVQLYAAFDGYGVYATSAPHRARVPRIVNAADFSTRPAAPGSLLSIVGAQVSRATGANLEFPVLAAAVGESQVQVPFEAVGPSVGLALDTVAGSFTIPLVVQPVSPAILVSRDGAPALFDADSDLPLDARNAAHSNGRVKILATGLGKVQPNWPTGMQAPLIDPPAVVAAVKVFLDGMPLQVTRATLAPGYVGFYLVEAQLPALTNAGTAELHLSAAGQDSNPVQILIEP
jgi:uncharacterized protein (TIGR03437 family)